MIVLHLTLLHYELRITSKAYLSEGLLLLVQKLLLLSLLLMLLRKSILLIHGLMLGKQERTLSRTLQMMLHMSMLLSLIHKMVCSLGGLLKEQTCIWLILIECLELITIPDKHVEIVVACMRSHIEHKPIDTGI